MSNRALPLLLFLLFGSLFLPQQSQAQALTKVSVSLDQASCTPGSSFLAAVELEMPLGWHTYWKNPSDGGELGLATAIEWTLPAGFSAGPTQWPVPLKLAEEGDSIYAYEGKVALLVPISVSSNATPGTANLEAKITWLECKTLCVKGKTNVIVPVRVAQEASPSTAASRFAQFRKLLPEPQRFPVTVQWTTGKDANARDIRVSFSASDGIWDFFPDASESLTFAQSSPGRPSAEGKVLLSKDTRLVSGPWPDQISGLLVKVGPDGRPLGAFEIQGQSPSGKALASATPDETAGAPSFASLLLFAFLGGLILNIMPCVLPVIALKILSFVRQGQESPARVRKLGLMYGAGVLASFGALAGIMIGLSLANRSVHQGILFQSSTFLVVMTTLVVLIALNLFGVFEVALGGSTMEAASTLTRKEGYTGAFFNGVLATALATPCSAPFLSLSLGFALQPGQKPSVTLLMYLIAGLGLALPYVVLCFQPRWLKLLPKPGPWMIRFKMIMGFPMLGTAVWLFLLAGNHYERDSLFWLGLFMVLVALAAWMYGEFIQRAEVLRTLSGILIAVIVVGGYVWMLESEVDWRHPPSRSSKSLARRTPGKHKIPWEIWSPEAVQAARAEGHPVFVDFTADYCTTCHQNMRLAIEVPAVIKKLKSIEAATLMGDFTLEDPAIAAQLREYRRSGVPLVLVYSINPDESPRVLPELLTESVVLSALEWAATKR